MSFKTSLVTLAIALLALNVQAARELKEKDFSGWMDSYEGLVYNEERNAFLYLNEARRGSYSRVLLREVSVFSEDSKTEGELAQRASAYLTAGVKELLADRDILATAPGPAVLQLSIAITGVEKPKEDVKAYNFVPVAAVFRGAQAATGNVATYLDTMFEAELVDSQSGERMGAIVAKTVEETEKRSGDALEFEDVVPTLDKWLGQFGKTLDGYLADEV